MRSITVRLPASYSTVACCPVPTSALSTPSIAMSVSQTFSAASVVVMPLTPKITRATPYPSSFGSDLVVKFHIFLYRLLSDSQCMVKPRHYVEDSRLYTGGLLFLMSFLPQFVNPALGFVKMQLLLLGLIYTLYDALFNLVAYLSNRVKTKMTEQSRLSHLTALALQPHASVGVYLALALYFILQIP
jgi:hypothetical protein